MLDQDDDSTTGQLEETGRQAGGWMDGWMDEQTEKGDRQLQIEE